MLILAWTQRLVTLLLLLLLLIFDLVGAYLPSDPHKEKKRIERDLVEVVSFWLLPFVEQVRETKEPSFWKVLFVWRLAFSVVVMIRAKKKSYS